jgi:hypothetical protein
MPIPSSMRKWLRLPSRVALLLGFGAFSAANAEAAASKVYSGQQPERVPQQSIKTFGDLLVWNEGGRIYLVEPGEEARELRLGDTPEAHRLQQLLTRHSATTESPRVLRDRIILVGGGGEGFHWEPPRRPDAHGKSNGSATRAPDKVPDPGSTTSVRRTRIIEKPGADVGGENR